MSTRGCIKLAAGGREGFEPSVPPVREGQCSSRLARSGSNPFQTWKPVFGGSRKRFCFTRTFSRRTITAEVGKLSGTEMQPKCRLFALVGVLSMALIAANPALAQKQGGILRVYHRDSPASMSIHEEGTVGVIMPMMEVFNNLVIFDQHVPQNSVQSILPELATGWAWSEDGTELTFKLRDGIKWHDGKPFTAKDVKCTFDLLTNQGKEKFRLNYRETWWVNVAKTTTGEHEAILHLKRPQPALLALLAFGRYPRSILAMSRHGDMRQHPIGTGPFKFVDYKPNQNIKLARNPDYWKPARLISTASNTRSSRTGRQRSSASSPASST